MATKQAKVSISDVPVQVWAILTSYLHGCDLIPLILASNKVMRHKLLKLGGVTHLELDMGPEMLDKQDISECPSPLPSLIEPQLRLYFLKSLPPESFFSGLRSMKVLVESRNKLVRQMPSILQLPRTLTSLEWLPTISKWDHDQGNALRDSFPNLLYLTLAPRSSKHFAVSEWLSFLPSSLIALRIGEKNIDELFEYADKLPKSLTMLVLMTYSSTPYGKLLGPQHYQKRLPESITDLCLSQHKFAGDQWGFNYLNLQRLQLFELEPKSIAALPRALTRLEVTHMPSSGEYTLQELDWPPALATLVFRRLPARAFIPCLPTLTRLKIYDTTADNLCYWMTSGLPRNPFNGSKFTHLDFPQSTFPEGRFECLPATLQRLLVLDVQMDGSSLPTELTQLDSIETLRAAFWQHPRSYYLIVLKKNGPCGVANPIKFNVEHLVSLKMKGHGLDDLSTLPNSITALHDIKLSNRRLKYLPPALTELNFTPKSLVSTIDPRRLFKALPNLTSLSTVIQRNGAAVLRIGEHFFPRQCAAKIVVTSTEPSESETQAPTTNASTQSHSSTRRNKQSRLPTLNLPDDAIAYFRAQHPKVEFINFKYETDSVCSGVPQISASKATFVGKYYWNADLVKNGFAPGLETLDISSAVLETESPGIVTIFPRLPNTLTDLSLGEEHSSMIIFSMQGDPSHQLPSSLTKLTLNGNMRLDPWNLSKDLPKSITQLVVVSNLRGMKDEAATHVRERFARVELLPPVSKGYQLPTLLVAFRDPAPTDKCNLM